MWKNDREISNEIHEAKYNKLQYLLYGDIFNFALSGEVSFNLSILSDRF